jgi:hypothetical protein
MAASCPHRRWKRSWPQNSFLRRLHYCSRYQRCSEKHLHRYLVEFDFRYSNRIALGVNDADRATFVAKGLVGKRLTYRRPHDKGGGAPLEAIIT